MKKYKIIFTNKFNKESESTYYYISKKLKQEDIAIKLFKKVYNLISNLRTFPRMYAKIDKYDKLKNQYHKIVINNYIVLYTVDDKNSKIYISHIFYQRRNYLHIL